MGLKKPSSGGGLPSDVVDKSGAQATFAASSTDSDGTNIRLHSTPTEKTLVDTASTITSTAPLHSFGDATVADVVIGKRFTSSAGLYQEGTLSKVDELIGIDAYPSIDGDYLVLNTSPAKKAIMDTSASIQVKTALSNLGDATAADVAAGKTFTSAAGVKVEGTGSMAKTKATALLDYSKTSIDDVYVRSFDGTTIKLYLSAGRDSTAASITITLGG